jgi:hypothetical protein
VLPVAKLGFESSVYIWSFKSTNYFGLDQVTTVGGGMANSPGLTVQQASSIDEKIDDGLPQSGRVISVYTSGANWYWSGGGNFQNGPFTTVTAGSSTSCFDNGGVSGPQQYSVEQNGGAGVNCALSFRFQ